MAKSFDQLVKRTTSKRIRARAAQRSQELLREMLLSEMRKLAGKSQREVAAALGIRQPSLSKLENQKDMQISTLRRIVEAMGAQLHIIAKFPNHQINIRPFDTHRRTEKRGAA
jgi:transcriptional regulator with XRE-family HTH domain